MKPEFFREMQRVAVFGASVVAQVTRFQDEGHGAPSEEDMARFIHEAGAVVDLHDRGHRWGERACVERIRAEIEEQREAGALIWDPEGAV